MIVLSVGIIWFVDIRIELLSPMGMPMQPPCSPHQMPKLHIVSYLSQTHDLAAKITPPNSTLFPSFFHFLDTEYIARGVKRTVAVPSTDWTTTNLWEHFNIIYPFFLKAIVRKSTIWAPGILQNNPLNTDKIHRSKQNGVKTRRCKIERLPTQIIDKNALPFFITQIGKKLMSIHQLL